MRMVYLTCKNHTDLRWLCKEIAYTPGLGYNGCRNIFHVTPGGRAECPCPASDLVLAPEEEQEPLEPNKYGMDAVLSALEVK